MIGVIFNHDIFDEPYKQTCVKKGLEKLESLCNNLNERLFASWSNVKRYGIFGNDSSDEYIIIHYTGDLSDSDKAEIANCIKEIVTFKKTAYKQDKVPEILIVFSKTQQNDVFCYNLKV